MCISILHKLQPTFWQNKVNSENFRKHVDKFSYFLHSLTYKLFRIKNTSHVSALSDQDFLNFMLEQTLKQSLMHCTAKGIVIHKTNRVYKYNVYTEVFDLSNFLGKTHIDMYMDIGDITRKFRNENMEILIYIFIYVQKS